MGRTNIDMPRKTARPGNAVVDRHWMRGPGLPWVLLGLTATLIRSSRQRLGAAIENALAALGEALDAEEARVVYGAADGSPRAQVWNRRRVGNADPCAELPPWIASRFHLERAVVHPGPGHPERAARDLPADVAAAIFAPLRIGPGKAGLLAVTATTPRSWTAEALETTRRLAEIIGAALEREATVEAIDGEQAARREAESETRRLRDQLAHVGRVTMLGEMAATLAHELRQPLTAIYSNAQAAQRFLDARPPEVGEARDALHDLEEDCRRAAEVLGRMRQMFRRKETERSPLPLGPLVQHVQRLLHEDAVARGVGVTVDVPADLPAVSGDRVQLEQVVMNLLANAFDAVAGQSPSARRHVAVHARVHDGAVLLTVRDTGPGIAPGDFERIFEPFFTRKSSGMGMGLSICRTIIHAHGGRITARAPETGGSQFDITLPALVRPAGAES